MKHRIRIGIAAMSLAAAAAAFGQAEETKKPDTVRAEVGQPLQAAQELLKSQRYAEALDKIAQAQTVPNLTPFEAMNIARMRGATAMSAGNTELAVQSFEAVLASGQLPAAEQSRTLQALAGVTYKAKDYAKSIALATRYLNEGGNDPSTRLLLIHSQYLGGAPADAAKGLQALILADEGAGRVPPEDQLRLLTSCYAKLNDERNYQAALEKLVVAYPKKAYWKELVPRLPQRPGFSNRLALDVYRLQLATVGTLSSAAEYVDMAELASHDSSPSEARRIVERGFAAGMLGTGAEADRHKRLRDSVNKAVADEQRSLAGADAEATRAAAAAAGTASFNLGWTLYQRDQVDKGLALMEQGLRKGGLKAPQEARLHFAVAALQAGQKEKAVTAFQGIQAADGAADLARLWLVHARDETKQ